MSCNGCRVLRKGCEDDCILRSCLSWIKSPESQANATLFLAKFYGRAGLLNLVNTSPHHLRPETFTSLLHEACGRIINPTYGSVGLMWSGNWELCQAVVDSVLQGSTLMQLATGDHNHDAAHLMPLEGCDIRHLSKEHPDHGEHHRVKIRNKFKRPRGGSAFAFQQVASASGGGELEANRATSHESLSVEIVEGSLLNHGGDEYDESGKVLLELSLG